MKVVEEAGDKLVDMLRATNPWRGENCGRDDCWLCQTKEMTGKNKTQDCTRRSIVYETWCETCLQRDTKQSEDETDDKDGDVKGRAEGGEGAYQGDREEGRPGQKPAICLPMCIQK